jgi:dolichol-phosphate mannosyltransferase
MRDNKVKKKISIVIPCFNEEDALPETIEAFKSFIAERANYEFEVIFIDDGSIDKTLSMLQIAKDENSSFRVVSFTRNFGHQAAVLAGLANCSGDAAVIIDADLQDPPAVIDEMLLAWEEGIEIAYGRRVERKGETAFKKISANLFYRILNYFSDVEIPRNVGDFQLLDKKVISQVLQMPEKDKYLRGLIGWTGYKSQAIDYVRDERRAGETKYTFRKMLKLAFSAILSFSVKPLYFVLYLGFGVAIFSIVFAIYFIISRIFGTDVLPGWTGLIVTMLFLGGTQLIAIGVLGIYAGRIFTEVQNRPSYIEK